MGDLLADSTAVVTGGSSGIGRAIGQGYGDHGASVVVADVGASPRSGGTPTHECIEAETDGEAVYVECDVTDPADLEAAIDAAASLGGLDVMVNNAGLIRETPFLDVTEPEYRQIMDVNVGGVYFGAQVAARRMRAEDGGAIINISSVAGIEGAANNTTYSTSKGAVKLLTYAMAAELAPEIRVNAIHPGYIRTEMLSEDVPLAGTKAEETLRERIPMDRLGRPAEVANAAVFLASDLASYVTGESLVVDGGNLNTV
jgi:NAD(P)-dependent dehydrogenase (short-subunit alcohol dehydrogenase family)